MATYAISDLHGNYSIWKQIQKYCKKDDTIFFLGDAIDRGLDGIKILQEIFEDNRFIFLLGNHEIDFLDYIEELRKNNIYNNDMNIFSYNSNVFDATTLEAMNYNGSKYTLIDFLFLSINEQNIIIDNLTNKTFINYIYNNVNNNKILLSHSGCNPKSFLKGRIKDFIWDRDHIKEDKWSGADNEYIIHGHTPVQLLYTYNQNKNRLTNVFKYCGNHKIDIDLGNFVSDKSVLLNLDTFEPKYFYTQENTKTLKKGR